MSRGWGKIRTRLHEPVLADRKLDVASGVSWFLLGIWGVFRTLGGQGIITHDVAISDYSLLWGLAIGVLSLVSGAAAISTLFGTRLNVRRHELTTELISLSLFTGVLSVVTWLQIVAVFVNGFNAQSIATAVITGFFLVSPTWRIFHLTERIRLLRKIVEKP